LLEFIFNQPKREKTKSLRELLRIVAVALSAVPALPGAAAMAAADFEAGAKAWEDRDFLTAFKILIPLAIGGHRGAQYLVGNMYLSVGWFGGDACRAVIWFEKAARGRHADALARCASIARRAAPTRMSRYAPIKLIPINPEPL